MSKLSEVSRRVVEDNGRVIRLFLNGELDDARRGDLCRAVFSVLTRRWPVSLKIDMSAVTSISESCRRTLLTGYVQALRTGHGFEVVDPATPVRTALRDAGLWAPDTDIPWALESDVDTMDAPDWFHLVPAAMGRETTFSAAVTGYAGALFGGAHDGNG